MSKKYFGVVLFLIVLALGAGLFNIRQKIKIERLNREALIAVDYEDGQALANLEGQNLADIFLKFKKAGAAAVVLKENTIYSLEKEGRLSFFTQAELKNFGRLWASFLVGSGKQYFGDNPSFLLSSEPALLNKISRGLSTVFGAKKISFLNPETLLVEAGKYNVLDLKRKTGELELDYDFRQSLGNCGVGLDPRKVRFLEALGLEIIPKLVPDRRLSADFIKEKINEIKVVSPRSYVVIFDDDFVPGYPEDLSATAAALKDNNLSFGLIELAEQKGATQLGKLNNCFVLPVHSASRQEVRLTSENQLVSRFTRACRERGARIINVYLIFQRELNPDLVALNTQYIGKIKNSLLKAGINPKKRFLIPVPLYPIKFNSSFVGVLFLTLGVAGGLWWLLSLLKLSRRVTVALELGFWAVFLILQMPEYEILSRQFLAWVAAVTFATLALIVPFSIRNSQSQEADLLNRFLTCLGLTLTGGLLVSAFLASLEFFLKITQFAGVKLFLITPFLLFLIYVKKNFYSQVTLKKLVKIIIFYEINVGLFLAFLTGAVVIAFYFLRSGNQARQLVPTFEWRIREFLENLLVARPRSKEIFLGYPALFFSLYFFKKYGRSSWFWVLALLGGLVPVSIIDSFAHAHTPVLFTLWRVFNGFWLGILIYLFYLVVWRIIRQFLKD